MGRAANGFSKKLDNLGAAISLHFMHANFCRAHQTLTQRAGAPTTPAMASGLADHVWTIAEMCELLLAVSPN